jgi:nitroreductase/dihydropteridine reductase
MTLLHVATSKFALNKKRTTMSLIENLTWRVAVKSFDPTKKLTEEQLNQVLDATRLAPSSAGMQPYRILVVENPEIREKLREAAFGQAQLTQASHVIVFAAETVIDEAYVNKAIQLVATTREMGAEHLEGFRQNILNHVNSMSEEDKIAWAKKQAYIALGVLTAATADAHIDICPMEGFMAGKFDEILGLHALGLTTAVIAPIGFRADDDMLSKLAKVRRPKQELFIHV